MTEHVIELVVNSADLDTGRIQALVRQLVQDLQDGHDQTIVAGTMIQDGHVTWLAYGAA